MKHVLKIIFLFVVSILLISAVNRPVHIFMAGDSTMADKPFYKNVTDSFTGEITQEVFLERGWGTVSYTHLDVYKRQKHHYLKPES